MTENERILVSRIAGEAIPGETIALCGSIQNYRRNEKKLGRMLSFNEAAAEWNRKIFSPIMEQLTAPGMSLAIGHGIGSIFFHVLYAVEENGFIYDPSLVRAEALGKAHGLRAMISKLIA